MSTKQPSISVIIPLLNNVDDIGECMTNITNQSLENIEIICIDGGSTDGTVEKIKSYSEKDSRINIYLSYKNSYGGLINHGISIASGKYVTILKIGGVVEKDMFETLHGLSQKDYIDVIQGSINISDNENKIVNPQKVSIEKAFHITKEPFFIEDFKSIECMLFKRSFLIHKNIHFLEESENADEYFFYETALKASTIKYTNKITYHYEKYSLNNNVNIYEFSKKMNELFIINKKYNHSNRNSQDMLYKILFKKFSLKLKNFTKTTDNFDLKTCEMLNKVLKNVNKEYARKKLNSKEKSFYYKFRSPLILIPFENKNIL